MRARALAGLALALAAACPAAAGAVPTLGRAIGGDLPWLSADVVPVGWVATDVASARGPVLVQVDRRPKEARGASDWDTRLTLPGPLMSGLAGVAIPVDDLVGTHEVRVVLEGAAGSPLQAGVIRLDRAAPTAAAATLEPRADGAAQVSWTQADDWSGTAAIIVEVNASPAGDERGAWLPFAVQPEPPWDGPHVATTPTAGLDEGLHLVRARAIDAAGNVGETTLGSLVVDRRPPAVEILAAVRETTGSGAGVAVTYRASDPEPSSGIAPAATVTLSGPGGRPIYGQAAAGPGQHVVRIPLPAGAGALVARIADRAGAVGESAPVAPTVGAGESVGLSSSGWEGALARFRGARIMVATAGARPRSGGRPTVLRRLAAGEALVIAGRLVDRDGRPLARAQVEVGDARGRPLGRALTAADGRFRRSIRPAAGGALRFRVADDQVSLPLRPSPRVMVRVVPRLTIRPVATRVRLGDPIAVRGRFLPAPAALGAGGRKTVDLEYLDPGRGRWRSGVTARLAADGSFATAWTPPAAGPLPIRARVRPEVAWPFGDVWSQSISIQVG